MIRPLVAGILAVVLSVSAVGAAEEALHSDNLVPVDVIDAATWSHQAVFKGDLMFVGTFDAPSGGEAIGGFDVFRLGGSDPIRRIGGFPCPGSDEGAISRWRNFIFQPIGSVPVTQTSQVSICGEEPRSGGIRVVDVSDPTHPRKAGFIELACGSHNVTPVPNRGRLWIFNSNGCGGEDTSGFSTGQGGSGGTALTVEVIKFNPKHPSKSAPEAKPTLHVEGDLATETATKMAGCHDITIYRPLDLGVCVGVGRSLLIDVSDPPNPVGLALLDTQHVGAGGANFSWDGKYVFLNEIPLKGAGYGESCLGARRSAGVIDVWDISNPLEPTRVNSYKNPRQPPLWEPVDGEYRCFAMDVMMVPTIDPKRMIVLSPWGTAGLSVIDFSDPKAPRELAYWTRLGPNITYWSYWYNGQIYLGENRTGEANIGAVRVLEMEGLGETHDFRSGYIPQWQDPADFED